MRRSRAGWRWIDGVDAPLAEEAERYRVTITPAGEAARVEETGAPLVVLSAGDRNLGNFEPAVIDPVLLWNAERLF